MKKSISNLKFAVYTEWSYDPPGGTTTFYYCAYGETYRKLLWPIDEIYDHLSGIIYDEEESEEFEALVNRKAGSRKYISAFNWDNGGIGGKCMFLVTGEDTVNRAIDFLEHKFLYRMESIAEEDENARKALAIIDRAKADPKDYDNAVALMEVVSSWIDDHNMSI